MKARHHGVHLVRPLALVLALVGATGSSVALAGDQHARTLFDQVQEEVLRYAFFTIFDDVAIGIEDEGAVTLMGKVTDDRKKRDLEQRVLGIDGVVIVDNQLEILPASTHDDRLRHGIARAIYRHPNFWRYGTQANPPIHIVVERGHVTLTGVVQSEVDRQLARAQAARFTVFSITNELRLAHEVEDELATLGDG